MAEFDAMVHHFSLALNLACPERKHRMLITGKDFSACNCEDRLEASLQVATMALNGVEPFIDFSQFQAVSKEVNIHKLLLRLDRKLTGELLDMSMNLQEAICSPPGEKKGDSNRSSIDSLSLGTVVEGKDRNTSSDRRYVTFFDAFCCSHSGHVRRCFYAA